MTTPAISGLKEKIPHASLTYIVEEPYRQLVEGNPSLDEIFVLPAHQKKREFLRSLFQIRRRRFDAVIDFHGGPKASWITIFSGARWKVGYKSKYKSFIYDATVPRKKASGHFHSVENHVNLIRALGVRVDSIPPLFLPQPEDKEKEKIERLIRENNLEDVSLIILHISAGNEFRNWGLRNIITLINLFSPHRKARVILVGSEKEKKIEREIRKSSQAEFLSLVGNLNLRELREIISRASLFVGPDSGPMHIAASTSTPIVALFGPTLPENFSPWKARAVILEKDFSCRPCRQKHCVYEDFRCLRSISPEEVYQKCLNFLSI